MFLSRLHCGTLVVRSCFIDVHALYVMALCVTASCYRPQWFRFAGSWHYSIHAFFQHKVVLISEQTP